MTAEELDLRAVEHKTVLAERAAHRERHLRETRGARAAVHMHLVGQHAGEGEGARPLGHRRAGPGEGPAKVTHLAARLEPRPVDGQAACTAQQRPGACVAHLDAPRGEHAVRVSA